MDAKTVVGALHGTAPLLRRRPRRAGGADALAVSPKSPPRSGLRAASAPCPGGRHKGAPCACRADAPPSVRWRSRDSHHGCSTRYARGALRASWRGSAGARRIAAVAVEHAIHLGTRGDAFEDLADGG